MPTCRICQHTSKSLKFQTKHIDICTRCVNTLNESPEPARNAEARFAEKLARGMRRNAERDLNSDEEWKRRKAQYTLDDLGTVVADKLHDWITKLLADPNNSTRDFKIMRAYRRGLLRMEGFSDYGDQNCGGRNWKEVARKIRHRDGFKCMSCDATNTTLDVHHIIYLSHHGTNQRNNLITLCRKCHEAEHEHSFDWAESQDPESESPIQPLHSDQTSLIPSLSPAPEPLPVSESQVNSSYAPEMMTAGAAIAGAYIEAGGRDFIQYAIAMIEELGGSVKPYLLSFWEGLRRYPGLDTEGMTDPVESARQHQALLALEEERTINATDTSKGSMPAQKPTLVPVSTPAQMRIERHIAAIWADRLRSQATRDVIRQLERMKADLSGDSGLKNAWEEICAQIQGEESTDWAIYEDTIEEHLYSIVEGLDRDAQLALWAVTDEGRNYLHDHTADRDAAGVPLNTGDIVTHLKGNVLSAAADYESPSLYRFIWGEEDPEYGEDDEDEADVEEECEEDDNFEDPILGLHRAQIDAFDLESSLVFLRTLVPLRNPQYARSWKSTLSLCISGYDDDPRELFEIPEVCRYLHGLDQEWPFWFFFFTPPSIKLVGMCLASAVAVAPDKVFLPPENLYRFMERGFGAVNHLFEHYGFPESESEELSKVVSQVFAN